MPKYRKKPAVVDAHRWHKMGDHPEDNRETFVDGDGKDFLGEGKVVRYFRHPAIEGQLKCDYCDEVMHIHGWIDTAQGGHTVCPGDWIIKETGKIKKGYYPCKPDVFRKTYKLAEPYDASEKESK